jgi:hypothetical protein
VRGSLACLAQRLGLEASPTAGADGLIVAVRDALRRGEPYSRWLIVFDNADQPEEIEDLIPTGPGDVFTRAPRTWPSCALRPATAAPKRWLRSQSGAYRTWLAGTPPTVTRPRLAGAVRPLRTNATDVTVGDEIAIKASSARRQEKCHAAKHHE